MKKVKAYIASPLGFAESTRTFYNETFIPLVVRAGFEILDPWVLTPQETIKRATDLSYGQEKKTVWQYVNKVIGKNNEKGIKDAKVIIAILDGIDVDSGTASEIGYGAALGKNILGYRGDFRLASDNEGSIVNLQVEYFITKNGGTIATTLQELEVNLKKLFFKLSK